MHKRGGSLSYLIHFIQFNRLILNIQIKEDIPLNRQRNSKDDLNSPTLCSSLMRWAPPAAAGQSFLLEPQEGSQLLKREFSWATGHQRGTFLIVLHTFMTLL